MGVDWPEPDTTLIAAGTSVLVKLNWPAVAPVTIALTLKLPFTWLAVKAGAVAMPRAFVGTVARALNVPLGPAPGAVKVTATFGTGLPMLSITSA